jgi:hypothetical protein
LESRDFDGFTAEAGEPAGEPAGREKVDGWLLGVEKPPAWLELWRDLCDERAPVIGADGELALNARGEARVRKRWNWRQALYIAWMATPKHKREPKTQDELADLLGLASTGTFRNWRRAHPEMVERIQQVPRDLLVTHLADVYDALVYVARSYDPRAHPDRKLFLELVGEYTPKAELKSDVTVNAPVALLPEADDD